jgi:[lysine-biosynthesis-protein LysW]--L-2-aminoadipate ligase
VSRDQADVALLASGVRADERRLLEALDRHGASYQCVDTRDLWDTADGRLDPRAPGRLHEGTSPGPRRRWRAVLNREIGQFRAACAARMLESLGVPVLNSAAAIETCGDKWRTSLALAAASLPTPRTALGLTPAAALAALEEDIGYPALVKPLTGSWGRLIVELRDSQMAEEVFEYVSALPGPQSHVVYVQELIDKPGRDIRAIVIGGELLGATYRVAAGTRTNVARGAVSQPCPQTAEIGKLAVAAAAAAGADIAAVDLIEDVGGQLLVLEVNHRPEFSGFQAAMGDRVDVADRITGYFLARATQW